MENQSHISASLKKDRWFVRVNRRINTVSGYMHIGMLQGAIMAIMFDGTALFTVVYVFLSAIFWGIGGYFKFKFRSKPNPRTNGMPIYTDLLDYFNTKKKMPIQ
jgi:hypothetical protein